MTSANAWVPPSRGVLVLCAVLMILLHVFDLLATLEILRHGGQELNPVARTWFALGDEAATAFKMSIAVFLAVTLCVLTRRAPAAHRRTFWRLLCLAIGLQTAIMCLHVFLLFIHPLL